MGILHLVTFTLFVIGSSALRVLKYQHLQPEVDNGDMHIPYGGKHWVVLVAGSDGWWNYRHQADICHAYQIIRRNGIPEENIITMMVDDIAYNSENPTPGMIINKPNGTDVYGGVVIDYKGDDVNVENFINIITGNKTGMHSIGTGKVVEGGIHDTVFINFVDHGSTGLLCFPNDYLYADQLIDALNNMHETRNYEKILLYIESCESGSMFDGILNENKKILAVTASGPRESSWGCYCDSDSEPYNTCLGDLFSVTWMEGLDATVLDCSDKTQTVFANFNAVRTNVIRSNVMIYGDFKIGHLKFATFIGKPPCLVESTAAAQNVPEVNQEKTTTVPSRDAGEKAIRYQLLMNENLTDLEKHKLAMKIRLNNRMRSIIDGVFQDIYSEVKKLRPDMEKKAGEVDEPKHLKLDLNVFPCYRSILNKITESCFSLPRNPYSLERLTIFANLCVVDKHIHQTVRKVVDKTCSNIPKNIKNVF